MDTPSQHAAPRLLPLALGALGIVFGDIGTSPLYALAECFSRTPDGLVKAHSLDATPENVLGLLSLFFWSLVMVVSVKYLSFLMRADNRGEGGIFALLALVPRRDEFPLKGAVVLAALFGAALLYGDGVITPAISVLSAVEGLGVATDALERFVVPLTLLILTALFLVQRHGTERIGRAFGPVMLLWFGVIGALGVRALLDAPEVLAALDPRHAVQLFRAEPWRAFQVLGSVVLCITGGEALYADMGHFGVRPIRLGWYVIVLPALLLNYFGQGAHLLHHGWVEKPFWALVPEAALYPMVALATAATVIASQALISGAFSLTRSAVQLGYLPRVTIVHTSGSNAGQIYVPEVNAALMVACLGLVLAFRESSALAAAYGVAVTGTMGITSIVYFVVLRRAWRWSLARALPLLLLFLAFDLPFFFSNAIKLLDGGWIPVAIGLSIFTVMTTWKRGRELLAARFHEALLPLDTLLADLADTKLLRVRGTAVFLSGNGDGTPPALLHHLKHNQLLHDQVVLLSIVHEAVPTVPPDEALTVEAAPMGFHRVRWRTGFMESAHVPRVLARAAEHGLAIDPATTSYFLGRETLLPDGRAKLARWRKALFVFLSRNALSATSYFSLPPGRVVELGMQIEL